MKHIRNREQFDFAIQELVGLKLAGVTYFEIEYETLEPCYLHRSDIGHFLDFGVEFRMACGKYRSFLWDGTFYQYGIGLFPTQANVEVNSTRQWKVDNAPEWKGYIGAAIGSADVYWNWVSESVADEEEWRTYYPQDIKLSFGGGKHIYISASQYMEKSDTLFGMSDEILIVFDEHIAKKYRIGPHAEAI